MLPARTQERCCSLLTESALCIRNVHQVHETTLRFLVIILGTRQTNRALGWRNRSTAGYSQHNTKKVFRQALPSLDQAAAPRHTHNEPALPVVDTQPYYAGQEVPSPARVQQPRSVELRHPAQVTATGLATTTEPAVTITVPEKAADATYQSSQVKPSVSFLVGR